MKSQATDWEKMFAKHISSKGLESKIKNQQNWTVKYSNNSIKSGQNQTYIVCIVYEEW